MTFALTYVSHSHLCNPRIVKNHTTIPNIEIKSKRVKIIRAKYRALLCIKVTADTGSSVSAPQPVFAQENENCSHPYPVCTRGSSVILDYPWCNLIFLEINGIHHFLVGFKWNWSHWVYCAQPSPSWLSVQIPSQRFFPKICPKRVLGQYFYF